VVLVHEVQQIDSGPDVVLEEKRRKERKRGERRIKKRGEERWCKRRERGEVRGGQRRREERRGDAREEKEERVRSEEGRVQRKMVNIAKAKMVK
jgi:hypothetical protein